jgi:hypothetical protein
MLLRVDTYQGREVVGQNGRRDCAGILFPYYWPGSPRPFNYRIRRDNPDYTAGKDGKPKPDRKYLGPPKSGNRLYVPPGVTLEHLQDLTISLIIVEGEKKALALWRMACHETNRPRFIPVAIAGVWNWRGKVGKTNGPKGERIDVRGPIADLGRIAWKGRTVIIVFDTNVSTNESVEWARRGIARELATRGADVQFINMPEDCGVNGVDDLLAAWGPARVLDLFDHPVSGMRCEVVLPAQFQSRPEGMFRTLTRGEHLSETQLSNYSATIMTSLTLDDGIETKREFEIESQLMGRHFRFTIPASQFSGMDWAIEQMGPGAITFPNQREYARTAIQWYSIGAEDRRIYTHTGWRNVDGSWLYLHAGGAIGAAGALCGVNVRLPSGLGRYELRLPMGPEAMALAVRASIRLVGLGPAAISFPLRAATCRAVLGDSDFSVHLVGETGAFKSEVAALEQRHFGASMTRRNLPGNWSSTANALEILSFHAKDTLFVVDDFAPQGSAADVSRYHAAADRVFRAAGNHADRIRCDSTTRLREPKPPRGLILSTGEDIPRGHSVRARLLILELSKGAITANKLTECQKEAEAGLYAEAMGAFIQWMAGRFDEVRASIGRKVAELRTRTASSAAHARTPEIIAELQAGFEVYLEFAEQVRAIRVVEREQLADQCWKALGEAAATQAKHQSASEPTARFLNLLRGCMASGEAHLAARSGIQPERSPESCGWRLDSYQHWLPLGHCVGWVDGENIYLEPSVAYRVAQAAAREIGEALSVSEQTLKKRLREKGLLVATDEKRQTLTVSPHFSQAIGKSRPFVA